jgi:hypothetical protein
MGKIYLGRARRAIRARFLSGAAELLVWWLWMDAFLSALVMKVVFSVGPSLLAAVLLGPVVEKVPIGKEPATTVAPVLFMVPFCYLGPI